MQNLYFRHYGNYRETTAIRASLEYLLVPKPDMGTGQVSQQIYHQESDTASFFTTFITSSHFSNGSWIIAPESREVVDRGTKPDLLLSKCYEYPQEDYDISATHIQHNLPYDLPYGLPIRPKSPDAGSETRKFPKDQFARVPRLAVEFKSTEGDFLEEALNQLIDSLKPRLEKLDTGESTFYQMFFMVARGPLVAFFAYYTEPYQQALDFQQIPHFRGCVSVTEIHDHLDHVKLGREIFSPQDIPNNLRHLATDTPKINRTKDENLIKLRDDARRYTTPCVFDVGNTNHRTAIDKILYYISEFSPRRLLPSA
jgi:hypothetical protein